MISLCTSPTRFICTYLVLMIPTYLLPYFGSNSILINGVGALIGRGMTPQWWVHAWSLVMLMVIASVRGKLIGKRFLLVFPLMAAAFDMVPGLNWMPLVPTVMHIAALILGAMGVVVVADASAPESVPMPGIRGEAWSVGLMTLAVCVGCAMFMNNIANVKQNLSATSKPLVGSTTPAKPAPNQQATAQTSSIPEPVPVPSATHSEVKPTPSMAKEIKKIATPTYPKRDVKAVPESQPKSTIPAPTVRMININD